MIHKATNHQPGITFSLVEQDLDVKSNMTLVLTLICRASGSAGDSGGSPGILKG